MTRILSLGQNNGLTIMILNLAPVRSYHLDTLSSLNFANRTKKIEVREIENEPIFSGKLAGKATPLISAPSINRQPLRPIPSATNIGLRTIVTTTDKPAKTFSVFAEKHGSGRGSDPRNLKRGLEQAQPVGARPSKMIRPSGAQLAARFGEAGLSRASIEELVNKMVDEKLAKQALSDADKHNAPTVSEEIQRRLEALEERVERKEDDGRAEGLQYLLMAKQHTVRGEESSALKMYNLALPFFPNNEKLARKMAGLEEKIRQKKEEKLVQPIQSHQPLVSLSLKAPAVHRASNDSDDEYQDDFQPVTAEDYDSDASFQFKSKAKSRKPKAAKLTVFREPLPMGDFAEGDLSPRSSNLLRIINTRDLSQIRMLRGVGLKKAEAIINSLCEMEDADDGALITSLQQLGGLRGVGSKTVENMRSGITV